MRPFESSIARNDIVIQQQQRNQAQHPIQNRIINIEEYQRTVSDLHDFLTALMDFKKKRAHQFLFSILQSLFLIFCTGMFFILHLKINFMQEIVFLPLYCNAIKDAVYHLKEMTSIRKFQREFNYFISKCSSSHSIMLVLEESYLAQLPYVFEHLFILLQLVRRSHYICDDDVDHYKLVYGPAKDIEQLALQQVAFCPLRVESNLQVALPFPDQAMSKEAEKGIRRR